MHHRSLIGWALGTLVFWCGASVATADFIVQYEMAGQPGDQTFVMATISAPGTRGSTMNRGLLTARAGADSMNSSGWVDPDANDARFFTFGFGVTPGVQVFVDALRFATRSSATGPGFVNVLYSADSGPETLITTITQPGTNVSENLLTLASSVTVNSRFRIFLRSANNTAAGGGTVSSAGTLQISDYSPDGGQTFNPISVEGRVTTAAAATPEPASALLLGLGGVGLVGMAWFRSRTSRALAAGSRDNL